MDTLDNFLHEAHELAIQYDEFMYIQNIHGYKESIQETPSLREKNISQTELDIMNNQTDYMIKYLKKYIDPNTTILQEDTNIQLIKELNALTSAIEHYHQEELKKKKELKRLARKRKKVYGMTNIQNMDAIIDELKTFKDNNIEGSSLQLTYDIENNELYSDYCPDENTWHKYSDSSCIYVGNHNSPIDQFNLECLIEALCKIHQENQQSLER